MKKEVRYIGLSGTRNGHPSVNGEIVAAVISGLPQDNRVGLFERSTKSHLAKEVLQETSDPKSYRFTILAGGPEVCSSEASIASCICLVPQFFRDKRLRESIGAVKVHVGHFLRPYEIGYLQEKLEGLVLGIEFTVRGHKKYSLNSRDARGKPKLHVPRVVYMAHLRANSFIEYPFTLLTDGNEFISYVSPPLTLSERLMEELGESKKAFGSMKIQRYVNKPPVVRRVH